MRRTVEKLCVSPRDKSFTSPTALIIICVRVPPPNLTPTWGPNKPVDRIVHVLNNNGGIEYSYPVPLAEDAPEAQAGGNPVPVADGPLVQEIGSADADFPFVSTGTFSVRPDGRIMEDEVLDVARVGFLDRKWLVSRKRTRNVFDAIATWRKTLLNQAGSDVALNEAVDNWDI